MGMLIESSRENFKFDSHEANVKNGYANWVFKGTANGKSLSSFPVLVYQSQKG